ncbi:ParB/RepB/Spo0J family partition protein [Microcoleus sp. FACHB-1515]|uniref:ParB/RepB/Spo0J family partition protein n=1 Tax=Cyanophyceae TaxID=3028117 RepID=UPI00168566DA|nr:ParB/RepB/Spo0J family partition protein [Microcoleus sp. FACHB-1515]MBD2093302.1 ParB/RepB/Spo0J family partition protein [Microcoleus sp. FACHB-1515]
MADIKKPNRFSGLMQTIRKESEAVSVEPAALPAPLPQAIASPDPIAPPDLIAAPSQAEVLWVARTKIHRDLDQDRRYFDETELDNMAASMRSVGMIDPLSVRRRPGTVDEYDLLAGEKRHRAAERAELDLVLVRIFEIDDQTADDIKSISNLQRSDLNAWEETAAMMKMLMRHLGRSQAEVVSLLNQAANEKRGLTSNVVRKEDWAIVEDVFEIAGRLSPESFRKHRLPLLRLPDEVQTVLQQGKLHYTKVNEILKVKDADLQQQLLQEATEQELSFDQLQEKVKALRPVRIEKPIDLPQRLVAVPRQLKQAKVWTDPGKRKKLEKLLAEMERLLEKG